MDLQIADTITILAHTPNTLRALLSGVSDTWTYATGGDTTWSAFDVVGHLLHGEQTDWMPRIRIILEQGEGVPFPTFDRTAMVTESRGKTLDHLLDGFAVARETNLAMLNTLDLTPAMLARIGTHPSLGRVTLGNLLATWAVHDLNHIGQIVEVMAHQYEAAVGPWKAYLAILTRPILTE